MYGEYLTHIRCLDTLRAQMNINTKVAQPVSEASKSTAPASMILLPDGILDFSDELSNDGDELLDDDGNEFKMKKATASNDDLAENRMDKTVEGDPVKAKLRIKTGGESATLRHFDPIQILNENNYFLYNCQFVELTITV